MLKEKSSFSYPRVTIGWNRALIITAGIIKYRTNKCNAKQAWVTYPRWHQIWTIVLDISLLQTASCVWGWEAAGACQGESLLVTESKINLGRSARNLGSSCLWSKSVCHGHRFTAELAINWERRGESQESGSMISDDTTKLRSSNRYGIGTKTDTQTSGTEEGA